MAQWSNKSRIPWLWQRSSSSAALQPYRYIPSGSYISWGVTGSSAGNWRGPLWRQSIGQLFVPQICKYFTSANRSKYPGLLFLCPECVHSLSGARAGPMAKGLTLHTILGQSWVDTQGPHARPTNVPEWRRGRVLIYLEKRERQVCNAGVLLGNTCGSTAHQNVGEYDTAGDSNYWFYWVKWNLVGLAH